MQTSFFFNKSKTFASGWNILSFKPKKSSTARLSRLHRLQEGPKLEAPSESGAGRHEEFPGPPSGVSPGQHFKTPSESAEMLLILQSQTHKHWPRYTQLSRPVSFHHEFYSVGFEVWSLVLLDEKEITSMEYFLSSICFCYI